MKVSVHPDLWGDLDSDEARAEFQEILSNFQKAAEATDAKFGGTKWGPEHHEFFESELQRISGGTISEADEDDIPDEERSKVAERIRNWQEPN